MPGLRPLHLLPLLLAASMASAASSSAAEDGDAAPSAVRQQEEEGDDKAKDDDFDDLSLDLEMAEHLATLPFECIDVVSWLDKVNG